MLMFRSLLFLVVFYVNTAVFLLLGSWLLLAPRRWAMEGLRLHGLASLWWLKVICGTRCEVRGREKLPSGACLVACKHQSAREGLRDGRKSWAGRNERMGLLAHSNKGLRRSRK